MGELRASLTAAAVACTGADTPMFEEPTAAAIVAACTGPDPLALEEPAAAAVCTGPEPIGDVASPRISSQTC